MGSKKARAWFSFRTSASVITLVRSTEGEKNTFLPDIAVLKENPVKKTDTGKKNHFAQII